MPDLGAIGFDAEQYDDTGEISTFQGVPLFAGAFDSEQYDEQVPSTIQMVIPWTDTGEAAHYADSVPNTQQQTGILPWESNWFAKHYQDLLKARRGAYITLSRQ